MLADFKKKKRSQITLFLVIIIPIIFILIFSIVILSRNSELTESNIRNNIEHKSTSDSLSFLITSCLELLTKEAVNEWGFASTYSEALIEESIKQKMPSCTDNFNLFEEKGYQIKKGEINVVVELTEEVMQVTLEYPLELTNNKNVINYDGQTYIFPRKLSKKIDFDKETVLLSSNERMEILIPQGTTMIVGSEQKQIIGLRLLDREFEELFNSVVMGMVAYEALPHDAVFSQPVTITIYYDESDLPISVEEENLQIGYYDWQKGLWISIPTDVNKAKNKLTTETTHFSEFAVVMRCKQGFDDTEWFHPLLIKEECDSPCENWNENAKYPGFALWNTDKVRPNSGIGSFYPECEKKIVQEPQDCVQHCAFDEVDCECEEVTYFYYSDKEFYGLRNVVIDFADLGETCIASKDDSDLNIGVIDSSGQKNINNADIILETKCSEGDECLINPYGFVGQGESKLLVGIKSTNKNTNDACLRQDLKVSLNQFGINYPNTHYSCSPGDKDVIPVIQGDVLGAARAECMCSQRLDGSQVCEYVYTGEIVHDLLDVESELNINRPTSEWECKKQYKSEHNRRMHVCDGNLETRDKMFKNSYGDFPDMEKTDTMKFFQDTTLMPYDAVLRDGECWLLIEAQHWIQGRKEKPDFYVKTEQFEDQCKLEEGKIVEKGDPESFMEFNDEAIEVINGIIYSGRGIGSAIYSGATSKCEGYDVQGIDVSHWQGEIKPEHWERAYTAGKRFVFIKATESNYFIDSRFEENIKNAKEAGFLAGPYHFARPTYNSGAEGAQHFAEFAGGYATSEYLRPVLDLEDGFKLSTEELTEWVEEFMDEYETITGTQPILYTSSSAISSELDPEVTKDYDIWFAFWGVGPTSASNNVFWQCSSNGRVDGLRGRIDLDAFMGSEAELSSYTAG